jgi:hypothetical protein
VGTYVATVLLGPGNEDLLAAGGSLTLMLGADGSVAGSFFIPASLGGPNTVDMAGTFSLAGNVVTFSQSADSFVRDVDWIWADDGLEANWDTGVGRASARLERSSTIDAPAHLVGSLHLPTAPSAPLPGDLSISVALSSHDLVVGDTAWIEVTVTNETSRALRYANGASSTPR